MAEEDVRRTEANPRLSPLKNPKRGRFAVRAMPPIPGNAFFCGLQGHRITPPSHQFPAMLSWSALQAVKEIIVDNSNPRASALKALAEHVRERAASGVSIVVAGPRRLTPTEEKDRQQSAECLAAELDNLAETINQNTLTFDKYVSPVLSKLHTVGITPDHLLVSEVARTLSEA